MSIRASVSALSDGEYLKTCHGPQKRATQAMKSSFAAQTRGGWVARSSRAMTLLGGLIFALSGSAAYAQQQMMAPLPAAPPGVPIVNLEARQATGQLAVPLDKSQLLHVDQAFGEISVGNRDIADVQPLTRNLIYVLGKKRGTTNITISDQGGNIIAVVDVQVGFDVDALRRGLSDIVPDERIAIRPAGDALILSGQVSSSDKLRQILAVSERYAPGANTNMLSISGSQQVLLQVKFAEVQRSAIKDLNANFNLIY